MTARPMIALDRYQPGACNIGPDEIARRRRSGIAGVAAALVVGLLLVVVDAPPWLRLAIFPPLAVGFSGFEQARRRFCAGFAMAGLRNFGPLGTTERVAEATQRAADRRAALRLALSTGLAAALATGAFLILPI